MKNFLHYIEQIEQWAVTLILILIVLLATYQIGLRWFTSGGVAWIDPLLRYLVLWGGLLGAVLATTRGQHISLDVVGYLIPDKLTLWLGLIIRCFSATVAVFLFRAALLFLGSEIEYGGSSLFNLPFWIWYLIFPISFGMIAFHFIVSAFLIFSERPGTKTPFSAGSNH